MKKKEKAGFFLYIFGVYGLVSDSDPVLSVPEPAVVQTTPVIFYGALLADERTQRVCSLNWNCIKEKREKKGVTSPAVTRVRTVLWLLGLNR